MRSRSQHLTLVGAATSTFCAIFNASSTRAAAPAPGELVQLNDNAAWCWFQDERAVIDPSNGQLLFASIASGDGVGGSARDGNADVTSFNLSTGATSRFTLQDFTYTADEHFTPALMIRPDGKYLAVYAAHQNDSLIRWRVSTNAGDATSWSAEQTLTVTSNQGTTYSNPFYLSSTGKVYDFYRGNNYDPHLLTSSDQGSSFAYTGHLLMDPANSSGQRPYPKYASNGVDKIYVFTTQAHPRDLNTGVYAGYYTTDGHLHKLDGTDIGTLGTNTGAAVSATAFTTVLAPSQVVNGTARTRAWTTDVALDTSGNPYMLFTSRVADADTDHRFYYARWNGGALTVTELGKAGSYLYAAENDYTGLGALDPSDPNTLYISTKIDPRDGTTNTSKYEIYRGFSNDNGVNWSWTPITINSTADNIRPIVPKWDSSHTALLWFTGTYTTYQHFNTAAVGKFYTGANGVWTNAAGGTWDTTSNWRENRIGTGLAEIADFSTLDYAGNANVTNGAARTLGFLTTGDTGSLTASSLNISGATITLDGGVIAPQINVKAQTTTIAAPLAGSNGMAKLGAGTLVLGAANSLTGLTQVNAGTLVIAHPDAVHDSVSVAAGADVKLSPGLSHAVSVSSLSISATGGAEVDLTDNALVIDYAGTVGTLVDDVRTHIAAGRLISSVADASHAVGYADNATLGLATFSGTPVDASSILVKYTFGGDANLDGKVDVTDLGALATNWQSYGVWTGGDFNYDGFVDVSDLGILATNWQAGVAGGTPALSLQQAMASFGWNGTTAGASVPEPAPAVCCFLSALPLLSRLSRRRWSAVR